ncbi:MAG: outer membrane protein assembly factor BamA [Rickettsiales bacterium]|nr:outer membrane protein assembly factor BamA [Rickettsiales bacterium]
MKKFFLIIVIVYLSNISIHAEVLKKIVIKGNQRIETDTIKSYLDVSINEEINKSDLNSVFKDLFATELFSKIYFNFIDNTLNILVKENPIINRIALEGNKRLDDDDIFPEILLKPRDVFTLNKVKNNLQTILGLYRANGRYAAIVEPKVIYLEQNRIDLVFEIKEGPLSKIGFIKFLGNKFFSDRRLKSEIMTRESRWWKILSSGGKFDPDLLSFDQQNLKRFYANKGFVDANIESSIAELNEQRDSFFITFTVNEGQRYKFGNISADLKIKNIEKKLIKNGIGFEKGEWFSAKRLDDAVVEITENIMKSGEAFIKVVPKLKRNDDNSINVSFDISPAEKKYVNKIIISGNTRTLDRVIRRKLRISEGDAYNRVLVKRSRILVNNLGHFSKVELTEEDNPKTINAVDINIKVEETTTGEFSLGGGYSSGNGAQATIGLSENNLFGKGQRLNFYILTSERQNKADFSFTEPFFLNRDVSLITDIYTTVREFPESNYDNETDGLGLGLGYNVGEYGRQTFNYTLQNRNIIAYDGASSAIISESGKNILSIMSLTNLIDKSDSNINPTDGWYISNNFALAGLGGDKKYIKSSASVASFLRVLEDRAIFSLFGKIGYIFGLGQDVEISDRFVLGDNSFVGFQNAGLGPRDKSDDSALGGNFYYTFTPELKFDLGLPQELAIKGRVFATAGSLTTIDTDSTNYYDDSSIRLTSGVGVLWQSPFGPIRLDYSHAILKESYDKTDTFSFNVGTLF